MFLDYVSAMHYVEHKVLSLHEGLHITIRESGLLIWDFRRTIIRVSLHEQPALVVGMILPEPREIGEE